MNRKLSSNAMYTLIGRILPINPHYRIMHLLVLIRYSRFKSSWTLVGINPVTHTYFILLLHIRNIRADFVLIMIDHTYLLTDNSNNWHLMCGNLTDGKSY